MKKLVLAALLAATAASADAAVTYTFAGTTDDGATVSGSITIDVDPLIGANGATDPGALYYYKDDNDLADSTLTANFLTVSMTSTGSSPGLLTTGDLTYQLLQADSSGFLQLEFDWAFDNGDGTQTSSQFGFSGFDLTGTQSVGGVLLPDFAHAGNVFFNTLHSNGSHDGSDVLTSGTLSFAAPSGVPEASSWAMMVLGFGAVGYAARRRARVAFA